MKKKELKAKPCPFCGGEAEETFNSENLSLCIQCTKCGAKGGTLYGHSYDIGGYIDDMRAHAFDLWNSRV